MSTLHTYLVLTTSADAFFVEAYNKDLIRAVAALVLDCDEIPANTVFIRVGRSQSRAVEEPMLPS